MQWIQNVNPFYVMMVTSLLTSWGVLGDKMDKGIKDYILKVHNDYRIKEVNDERASNLPKLVWNKTLEDEADAWSTRCRFEHKGMGENLAYNSNITAKEEQLIDRAMQKFYDEKNMYSYGQRACSSSCHYTQLVWAATTDVGCASRICKPSLGNTGYGKPAWFLVCRYNPVGNWIDQKPYVKGGRCGDCANMNAGCDDGLCVGGQPKPVECKNDRAECPEWAGRGECKANESFMSKSCKKACKKC